MSFKSDWLHSCFSTETPETATVYKDGKVFATYSKHIAFEVADEIGGEVVSDETGEILYPVAV